jgi:hypothetical protein
MYSYSSRRLNELDFRGDQALRPQYNTLLRQFEIRLPRCLHRRIDGLSFPQTSLQNQAHRDMRRRSNDVKRAVILPWSRHSAQRYRPPAPSYMPSHRLRYRLFCRLLVVLA